MWNHFCFFFFYCLITENHLIQITLIIFLFWTILGIKMQSSIVKVLFNKYHIRVLGIIIIITFQILTKVCKIHFFIKHNC